MIVTFRHKGLRQLFEDDLTRYIIEGDDAMSMKKPPHPGQMIGDSLEEMGVSISQAAKGLGVTRQQLHNIIAGRCAIVPEMAFRLERAIGSTADAWLRMQASYDLAHIRAHASSIKVSRIEPEIRGAV